MDAEPKTLRTYLLATTLLVVVGGAAGLGVFLQMRGDPAAAPIQGEADVDAVQTRAFPPLEFDDDEARARFARALERATNEGEEPVRRAAAEELIAMGPRVVPALLTVIHGLASTPAGFDDKVARFRLLAADLPLRRIRGALTPEDRAVPWERSATPAWCLRRAKSWFRWWDVRTASPAAPR